jgi:catechol 2,3-dioxygenase-like lactoylglutathione lyase family enzyme
MHQSTADRFGLGGIDQIGYVVADLETSIQHYESLFGPFKVGEAQLDGVRFRGKEMDCKLKIATNNDGPVEIELIQVLEGETPHTEHLRAHGEGPHHVRFRIADIETKIAALESAGYENIFFKRFGPTIAFSYLESPREMGGALIELFAACRSQPGGEGHIAIFSLDQPCRELQGCSTLGPWRSI